MKRELLAVEVPWWIDPPTISPEAATRAILNPPPVPRLSLGWMCWALLGHGHTQRTGGVPEFSDSARWFKAAPGSESTVSVGGDAP